MKNLWRCRCNTHAANDQSEFVSKSLHVRCPQRSSTSNERTPETRRPTSDERLQKARGREDAKKLYFSVQNISFVLNSQDFLPWLYLSPSFCLCFDVHVRRLGFVCHHVLRSKWKIIACFDHRLFLLNTPVRYFRPVFIVSIWALVARMHHLFEDTDGTFTGGHIRSDYSAFCTTLHNFTGMVNNGARGAHTAHTSTDRNWFPFFVSFHFVWQCLCSPHASLIEQRRLFSLPIFYLWRKIWSLLISFEQNRVCVCILCCIFAARSSPLNGENRWNRSTMPSADWSMHAHNAHICSNARPVKHCPTNAFPSRFHHFRSFGWTHNKDLAKWDCKQSLRSHSSSLQNIFVERYCLCITCARSSSVWNRLTKLH